MCIRACCMCIRACCMCEGQMAAQAHAIPWRRPNGCTGARNPMAKAKWLHRRTQSYSDGQMAAEVVMKPMVSAETLQSGAGATPDLQLFVFLPDPLRLFGLNKKNEEDPSRALPRAFPDPFPEPPRSFPELSQPSFFRTPTKCVLSRTLSRTLSRREEGVSDLHLAHRRVLSSCCAQKSLRAASL